MYGRQRFRLCSGMFNMRVCRIESVLLSPDRSLLACMGPFVGFNFFRPKSGCYVTTLATQMEFDSRLCGVSNLSANTKSRVKQSFRVFFFLNHPYL